MSHNRDSSPVYYREIQKNAFLKRLPDDTGGKLRPLALKKPPPKPLWTQLCVHNGRTLYLEQYRDPTSARAHRPIWRASLASARHVTASVTSRDNEYDFLVDTHQGPVRMLAPDWESMQDWVTTLRNKLHELKIVPLCENVYCTPPAAPLPRAAARDPTSPLPPTPPVPPHRVPGIEIAPVRQTQPEPNPEPPQSNPTLSNPPPSTTLPSHPTLNPPLSTHPTLNPPLSTHSSLNPQNNPSSLTPPSETPPEIDISLWDTNTPIPSTSQNQPKSVTKICGQNICLDDSIFKRSQSDDDDDEDEEFKQMVVVGDEAETIENGTGDRQTNITVIKVSNKEPPHTAIPVIGSETDVFDFNFKQALNHTQTPNFINIVNTEVNVQNDYGTVFNDNNSDYGHLSLTTTVSLTGDVKVTDVKNKEGLYERLCMASTSNDVKASPLSVRRLKGLDKTRKSSLPNLDVVNSDSTYEYLFLSQNNNSTGNVTLNSTVNSNSANVTANSGHVTANSTSIPTNSVNIPTNLSNIQSNFVTTSNSSHIPSNTNNVTANSAHLINPTNILSNSANITTNLPNLQSNSSNLQSNSSNLQSNSSNLQSNSSNLQSNSSNLQSNSSNLQSNSSNIQSNSSNLQSNSTNMTSITTISSNNDTRVHVNSEPYARVIRSNIGRTQSQNVHDTSPRREGRNENGAKRNGKVEKQEVTQPKPIWKRGLTELSLLTRLRGMAHGKRQDSPTRTDNDRNASSPVKVVHRSRPEARVDRSRRRSSSLSNGQSPPSTSIPPGLQPLRARQADLLRSEQRRGAALVAAVKCNEPPVFVDYNGQVWVCKWGSGAVGWCGRAGDRVCGIRAAAPTDAHHARMLINNVYSTYVDILFHRVPLGKIFVINKRDQEQLGIKLDNECNITSVEKESPAGRAGLPPPGKWAVTEVNNRPVNLIKGGEEDMNRLSLHGTEASVLIQPTALVKKLRASLKGSKHLLGLR